MATTTVESAPTLDESAVQALAATMRGPLIQPGDPGYDAARTVYNAMIDKHPALIARCATSPTSSPPSTSPATTTSSWPSAAAATTAPDWALSTTGWSSISSPMNGVRVDPVARTARVEGGALLGDLHHATHAFGLATPSGIISTTGVGGITLGGGIGHLTRQFGLAIDNLLEADVVLADGSFVTASETEHPDLFWALRGGGGNFGVVTSFLFKLHPIPNLYAGPMLWPLDALGRGAALVPRLHHQGPGRAQRLLRLPDGARRGALPGGAVEPEDVRRGLGLHRAMTAGGDVRPDPRPVRSARPRLGRPDLRTRRSTACSTGSIRRATSGTGRPTSSTRSPTRPSIIHVEYAEQLPTGKSTMHLYPIDGVAGRVAKDATAWNYRDAKWGMVMVGVSPDPADNAAHDRLDPRLLGGAASLLGGRRLRQHDDGRDRRGQDRVRASYGDHYDRLAADQGASTTRTTSSASIRTSNRRSPSVRPLPARRERDFAHPPVHASCCDFVIMRDHQQHLAVSIPGKFPEVREVR